MKGDILLEFLLRKNQDTQKMQAIKEKLNDMGAMRKAKAEAKEEEKAERELAKTRVEVAHEVRLAREAEAAMDLHVNKAADKAAQHEAKHHIDHQNVEGTGGMEDPYGGGDPCNMGRTTSDQAYGGGTMDYGHSTNNPGPNTATTTGTGNQTKNTAGAVPRMEACSQTQNQHYSIYQLENNWSY